MKKSLLILCFLHVLCYFNIKAQSFQSDYTPLKYSSSGYKMAESSFYKKMKFKYNTTDKTMIRKFNKYLYELHKGYANGSKEKNYIEEPFVKKYLKSILDTVLAKNNISEKFDIVCTRYTVPNAFNMGDNKLYINIGILEQLNNEAQLAFLLCHELSHQLLFHVQNNFIAQEKLAKDKNVKKEIRNINRAKYNKLDRTFQFLKNYNYDFAKYSRANEKSADSMAVVLIKNTAYDLREGKGLMEILDHCDEDSNQIAYPAYFNSDSIQVKDEWTKAKKINFSFGNKKELEFDKDSIKTHPDIPNRIHMIDSMIKAANYVPDGKLTTVQGKSQFDSLKNASKFEVIEIYNHRKRYSAVVYHSLVLLKEFPENKYLYKRACIALHELNKANKKHTIQNHIPIESEEDLSEGYNQLLRIIDRTTSEEFDKLVRGFILKNYSRVSSFPEIVSLYNEISKK